jgi:hypothetical protein
MRLDTKCLSAAASLSGFDASITLQKEIGRAVFAGGSKRTTDPNESTVTNPILYFSDRMFIKTAFLFLASGPMSPDKRSAHESGLRKNRA